MRARSVERERFGVSLWEFWMAGFGFFPVSSLSFVLSLSLSIDDGLGCAYGR